MASSTELTPLRLENAQGISATFVPFGARIVELCLPDRQGRLDNVVLGFDDELDYRRRPDLYFGATIGRVAGRIAGAGFTLDGHRFSLTRNEGATHLHGGRERSLDRVDWSAEPVTTPHGPGVAFAYRSPDGEEGYPGTLDVVAEYVLSDDNELRMELRARSDAPTPVNLTNHAYWNLAGAGSGDVLGHELRIAASSVVALDEALVPTGGTVAVDGTALDFRRARPIGARLPDTAEPWPGFDSAYVLDPHTPDETVVELHDPVSGRRMELSTTEPSIQMYTGNRIPRLRGRHARSYRAGGAICLEPQGMPDAVNRPEFPSIVLRPGDEYRHVSRWRFSVQPEEEE